MIYKEPYEKLFCVGDVYIYIQYLYDDNEYDFDYTIYDVEFNDVDGGVFGESGTAVPFGGSINLRDGAEQLAEEYGLTGDIEELDIEDYRDKLE